MLTKMVSFERAICQRTKHALLFKMICSEPTDFITCLYCFKWVNAYI
jgi:hypothetical protein